jgi:hypothetical protein
MSACLLVDIAAQVTRAATRAEASSATRRIKEVFLDYRGFCYSYVMIENPTDKKSLIEKLKDKVPDREEQFEYVSIAVRLLVVFWSGALVTLNYLPKIPGLTSGEKQDITFPASLLASSLASFGLEKSAKKKGDGTYEVPPEDRPMTKKEMQTMMTGQGGNYQTIRVLTPIEIKGAEVIKTDPITGKAIDPQNGKLK